MPCTTGLVPSASEEAATNASPTSPERGAVWGAGRGTGEIPLAAKGPVQAIPSRWPAGEARPQTKDGPRQARHLNDLGYSASELPVSGLGSTTFNGRSIADAVLRMDLAKNERLILLGYSKGLPDILEGLADSPDATRRVSAVVGLAGAVNGSPLTENAPEELFSTLQNLPPGDCRVGDGEALDSLRQGRRLTWMSTHALPRDVRYFSLGVFAERERISQALRLLEPPLVSCYRGFGALVVRENVPLPDGSPNPMPLIQIPYARLNQKQNLTSVLHEDGHIVFQKLGLVTELPEVLRAALRQSGAPEPVRDLFALWSSEIGPDFWAFCLVGAAEAAALLDLFALDPPNALRITSFDPHPPPVVRTLLAIEWCRIAWGRGPWDRWESYWKSLYPLALARPTSRRLHFEARRHLPDVARTLFTARLTSLDGRALPDRFDLASVAPDRLARIAAGADTGRLDLRGLSPCAQLAVFGAVRERGLLSERALDRVMTPWLIRLGRRRHHETRKEHSHGARPVEA